jgi:diguanylate cyclase (GGDEF)-like protein
MNRQKILIVDDTEVNRSMLMGILGDDYDYIEAADGTEAIHIFQQDLTIDLVLLDITMPKMDGFEVLRLMNQFHWIDEIPVITITAADDHSSMERCYELGATDYIRRPFDAYIVRRRVQNTLNLYANQKRLTGIVSEQIYHNEKNSNIMIAILSHIVEFRNSESGQHVVHIRTATELLLRSLVQKTDAYDLPEEKIRQISTASALHDIGKISIPTIILNKPGPLTPEEFATMKTHTTIGAAMLEALTAYKDEPLVKTALEICRWHHERWDGHGYPDRLLGEDIPISAQVVALADVYDALTSERCYKKAYSHDTAVEMILNGECGAFNPLLLDCLRDVGPQLRVELSVTDVNQPLYRSISRLSTEILQHNEIPRNDRSQRLLDNMAEKLEFFASCCGGIQFDYDNLTGISTSTNWDAPPHSRQSKIDYFTQNPNPLMTEEDLRRLKTAMRATTPENNEFSVSLLLPAGKEFHWYDIRIRTLWSPLQPDRYVGAVGHMVDVQKQEHESKGCSNCEFAIHAAPEFEATSAYIQQMQQIFDVVRLVDPQTYTVLELDKDGILRRTDQRCHAFWRDDGACANCISNRAFAEHTMLNKLEFTGTDMYYVISRFVCVNGTHCVMEFVSKMNEGRWIDANGTRFLLDRSKGEARELFLDPLTRVFSRRYFEAYRTHLEGMEGVMVMDVNDFKQINDTYGHPTGDTALRSVANAVRSCVRGSDLLIRYGGDEFVLLLPQIESEMMAAKQLQIKQAVSAIRLTECPNLRLSISIGGVCDVHPISDAIQQADKLMYRDKATKPSPGN